MLNVNNIGNKCGVFGNSVLYSYFSVNQKVF